MNIVIDFTYRPTVIDFTYRPTNIVLVYDILISDIYIY